MASILNEHLSLDNDIPSSIEWCSAIDKLHQDNGYYQFRKVIAKNESSSSGVSLSTNASDIVDNFLIADELSDDKQHIITDDDDFDDTSSDGANDQNDDDSFVYPIPDLSTFVSSQKPINAHWLTHLLVRLSYLIKFLFAYIREYLQYYGWESPKGYAELAKHKDFVPIVGGIESLFIRNIYRKGSDAVNRVISSVPGTITRMPIRVTNDHGWTYEFPGTSQRVLNMASYNYLGFAQNRGPCADSASSAIDRYGIGICSSSQHFGKLNIHRELEQMIAEFIGVEAAMCFPMGFNTNAMNIPALVNKNSLIISDELNHASLVLGCRLSGATIRVFKHNDMVDLEEILRNAVVYGHPITYRPFNKILIVIEGIYSMEGTISPLPAVIELKKKYGAYLFLDEAHSIGALGRSGRGIVEYFGCNPHDVDVMMGTLTKSFAAAGGYIAGSQKLIDHLRSHSHDGVYGNGMSPPIAQQVISTMHIITGRDGTDDGKRRINQLMRNTHYFRKNLQKLGFLTFGHIDSPVVPCVSFYVTRTLHFIRETLKCNLAIVGVCYPATPMTKCRARFCLSAGHTKRQLDWALKVCEQVAIESNCKYGSAEMVKKWANIDIKY